MDAGEFLRYVNIVLFALLAIVAGRKWHRRRGPAALWAFATFVILAWVTAAGAASEQMGVDVDRVVTRFNIAVLAVFPYALYRFVSTLRPRHSRELTVTTVLLLGVIGLTLALPTVPLEGEAQPSYWRPFLALYIAHWAVMTVLITARLWRASRSESSAARRRIRFLGFGAGTMGVALVVAGFASGLRGDSAEAFGIATQVLAMISVVAFYLGYAPPYFLRVIWRAPEELQLRRAVAELIEATDIDSLVAKLLPTVTSLLSGRGAALIATDGTVVGCHRVTELDLSRALAFVERHLAASASQGRLLPSPAADSRSGAMSGPDTLSSAGPAVWVTVREDGAEADTFVATSFPYGHLIVWTTSLTTFFGSEEIALLRSLGAVTDLAINQVTIVEQERETTRRMREVNELKNEFVAMVVHDLRSPMTVISGFVDTIISRWDTIDDAEKIEYLRMVSRNTKSLAALVEDVLQVSRIESGEFGYELAHFDLRRTIARTVRDLQAAHAGRDFVVEVPDELPHAWGDEERNWQVLTNLLSNAVKFSPEDRPVEVGVRAESQELCVAVRDHGAGIREEDKARLFQKFSRLDSTRAVKGTGLGLYICKSLVEAQGGRIWVESAPSAGSTFMYTIPLTPGDGTEEGQ